MHQSPPKILQLRVERWVVIGEDSFILHLAKGGGAQNFLTALFKGHVFLPHHNTARTGWNASKNLDSCTGVKKGSFP